MQLKKITTFTLLAIVLIICSLTTISAATHNIDNTTVGGINGTLNSATPGDTIILDEGTYTSNNNTNITIKKNITIQGKTKNKVILDAQGLSRIFTINNNLNVTFINLTFINGNFSSGSGGAIYNSFNRSILNLINCSFDNNQATGDGGAIFNAGSYSSIFNCNFSNNQATVGGAIRIYGSSQEVSITNCTFINNSATTGGGAIHNPGTSYNNSITNCNFINNQATAGGAIRNTGMNQLISNCTFINNSATNYGGAITNIDTSGSSSSSQFVFNCIFINNSAIYGGATSNMYDGNRPANQSLTNCTFIDNSATNYGGAVFNDIGCNLTVSNNTMSDNVAGLGQMIYNNGNIGILNLTYLNNSTLAVLNGSTITIYATLTDDMGNTITGQDILFYVDGIFIANLTSIEGQANTTYLVNKTPVAILPVTGEYSGHEGYSININNGQLEIIKRNIIVNITIEENLDGSITVIANATYEDDGTPVIDHPVDFILNDEIVGTGITDENGIAKITIPANKIKNGTNNITVIVKGDENSNNGTTSTRFIRTSDPNPVAPIGPIDPVNPVDPNNPNEPSEDEKTSNNSAVKTSAAMKKTGIPINLILLVLLTCLGIVIRKTRK